MTTIGIIPAAGYGTRLAMPFPKELMPITVDNNKLLTVIESNVKQLAEASVDEIVIVVRAEKPLIAQHLGPTAFGVRIRYVLQRPQQTREGLPDAVLSAEREGDLFIMLMGDVYFTAPGIARRLRQQLQLEPEAIATVGTWETDQPWRFGIVEPSRRDPHYVHRVLDKPQYTGTYPMWGVVAFRDTFWSHLALVNSTFSDALHNAATACTVSQVPMPGQYLDLGTPKSFTEGFVAVNR